MADKAAVYQVIGRVNESYWWYYFAVAYEITYEVKAEKTLSKLDPNTALRITEGIDRLATDPRPQSARKLVGQDNWRIRIGDYRVIYSIIDNRLLIHVLKIGHRADIYKR